MVAGSADDQVRRNVEKLLGIASAEELAMSLIERAALPGGRVESHEFGRDQHSSASAGAVLMGMAGVPSVSDHALMLFFQRVADLVDQTGSVKGHDADADASMASWAISQILLGLLLCAERLGTRVARVDEMVRTLVQLQDQETGGWPLRPGEDAMPAFSFYPTLALARVWRSGVDRGDRLARSLRGAADYLATGLRASTTSLEELLLMRRAFVVLRRTLVGTGLVPADLDLRAITDSLRERALSRSHGMLLQNRPVVQYRQPTWHVTLWRPLLFPAVRGPGTPISPLDALLAHELVGAFRKDVRAWCGPVEGSAPNGTSWASALALRGTFELAADLTRHGITVDDWLNRCRDLQSDAFEFDVAVSFAGADRKVAREISAVIGGAGYQVFYDTDQQHMLLGEDLAQYLHDMYFRRSRYAVVVVSADFVRSKWAGNWEWRAVLARMQSQREPYVLPYVIQDVPVPGLNPTIGYVSMDQCQPGEFGELVVRKLRAGLESRESPD